MSLFARHLFARQVVLVTGGSRGIGAAAARAFAEHGATVYIAARHAEELGLFAASLRAEGLEIRPVVCDVTDLAAVTQMYDRIAAEAQRLDVVLACAGVPPQRRLVAQSDPDLWRQTVLINLVGAYHTAYGAIPHLTQSGGKLLFIGSGRGLRGSEGLSDYACAKAGIHILVKDLAIELAPSGVAVNEIIPGPVETRLGAPEGMNRDLELSGEVLKQPSDVSELILFVAALSGESGPTGQTFCLNRREVL